MCLSDASRDETKMPLFYYLYFPPYWFRLCWCFTLSENAFLCSNTMVLPYWAQEILDIKGETLGLFRPWKMIICCFICSLHYFAEKCESSDQLNSESGKSIFKKRRYWRMRSRVSHGLRSCLQVFPVTVAAETSCSQLGGGGVWRETAVSTVSHGLLNRAESFAPGLSRCNQN